MISVNGKDLNFNDKNDPHVKRFMESIEKLRRISGGSIVLDWTESHFAVHKDDKRQREHATEVTVPMTQNFVYKGINERWVYYNDTHDTGKKIKYLPKSYPFKGDLGFNSEAANMELLFFLVFVSPQCEKLPKLLEFQNPAKGTPDYRLLLPELAAADEVALGKKIGMIQYQVYNKLEVEQIRTLAQAFGISGTEKMRENSLKLALVKLATENEESMDRFLNNYNINPSVEFEAVVNLAIEKNLIHKRNQFGRPRWVYKTTDGKIGEEIVPLAKGENDKQALIVLFDYFKGHLIDFDALKERVYPKEYKVPANSEVNQ